MKHILISQRVDVIESYNEHRDALDQRWAELLWESGYVGLPVPNHASTLTKLLETLPIDGILLTGGNTPTGYGGSAPERDETDNLLISYVLNTKKPLLGVCRGMQSIVIYFGGTMRKIQGHIAVRHDINIDRNVNSYHEYAPDILPNDFTVLAQTSNGEIESIRHNNMPIVGIMWHPEREAVFLQEDIELIKGVFK